MTRVFLSTWGQNYNLGDSVLRRGLLRAFRHEDTSTHVFVGDNDDEYLSALDLRPTDVLYRSRAAWWRGAATHLLGERTVLVQTAGEVIFSSPSPLAGWRSLVGAQLVRVRGGAAAHAGGGMRDPRAAIPRLEHAARRRFSLLAWRDADTRDAFDLGEVAPDWAFGEGPAPAADGEIGTPAGDRHVMAVTMRGDAPALTPEQAAHLRAVADRYRLRPRVFTQVRPDAARAHELTDVLGADDAPLVWQGESHADWETQVRALLGASRVVVSDRAHALIVGSTEGALPVGVSGGSVTKVRRLLRPAGFELPDGTPDAVDTYLDTMLADTGAVTRRIAVARAEVLALAARAQQLAVGRTPAGDTRHRRHPAGARDVVGSP